MNALLERRGTSISAANGLPECQVTAIEPLGLWLLVGQMEYFVPFSDYPGLGTATLDQIFAVQLIAPDQLRWEALDIDIELEALAEPEHYPLAWQ